MTFEGLLQCLILKDLEQNDLLWRIITATISKGYITDYDLCIFYGLNLEETDLIRKYQKALSPVKLQVYLLILNKVITANLFKIEPSILYPESWFTRDEDLRW